MVGHLGLHAINSTFQNSVCEIYVHYVDHSHHSFGNYIYLLNHLMKVSNHPKSKYYATIVDCQMCTDTLSFIRDNYQNVTVQLQTINKIQQIPKQRR